MGSSEATAGAVTAGAGAETAIAAGTGSAAGGVATARSARELAASVFRSGAATGASEGRAVAGASVGAAEEAVPEATLSWRICVTDRGCLSRSVALIMRPIVYSRSGFSWRMLGIRRRGTHRSTPFRCARAAFGGLSVQFIRSGTRASVARRIDGENSGRTHGHQTMGDLFIGGTALRHSPYCKHGPFVKGQPGYFKVMETEAICCSHSSCSLPLLGPVDVSIIL